MLPQIQRPAIPYRCVGELWRSDGSAGGTFLVKDINPGPNGSLPVALTNLGGTLYFAANDGTTRSEEHTSELQSR